MTFVACNRALRLVVGFLLVLGTNEVIAQTPNTLYEPVLQNIQSEYPSRPLLLYSTILKLECYQGGCDQPWAGTFPQPWMEQIRSRSLISEFCTYEHGLCTRPDGHPISGVGGVYVMLSTQRSCGAKCAEVLATHTLRRNGTSIRRHMLYRLIRGGDVWIVSSVKDGGKAILN